MSGFMFFVDGILPYISVPILLIGTIWQLWRWFSVPLPLRIGLAPVPTTQMGVVGKIAAEVFLFRTFFDSERAFWFVVWPFHVVGLFTLAHHVLGFGQDLLVIYWPHVVIPQFETILFVLALGAWLLIAFLLYILVRRLYMAEIRRMSFFGDYVAVLLILGVVAAGTYMSSFSGLTSAKNWHETALKWGMGLVTFRPTSAGSLLFSIHFLFVQALFIYFPFSKLFHPFGQVTSRMMSQKEELLHPETAVVK